MGAAASLERSPLTIPRSFRNAAVENATVSFSIRDHSSSQWSPAAHPRLSLQGKIVPLADDEDHSAVQNCFLRKHPDAKLWMPGNKIHESYWTRFEITSVFWVGGFGSVAYIGRIPVEMYKDVEIAREEEFEKKSWWRAIFNQEL